MDGRTMYSVPVQTYHYLMISLPGSSGRWAIGRKRLIGGEGLQALDGLPHLDESSSMMS